MHWVHVSLLWHVVVNTIGHTWHKQSVLFPVNLTKWISMSIHPYICLFLRLSTKTFFQSNWYVFVGRDRWMMHDSMWPSPRSRSRSHDLESSKLLHFQNPSPLSFKDGAGKWRLILKLETMSKCDWARFFFILFLVYVSRDLRFTGHAKPV